MICGGSLRATQQASNRYQDLSCLGYFLKVKTEAYPRKGVDKGDWAVDTMKIFIK
jgi:hypothetical protein